MRLGRPGKGIGHLPAQSDRSRQQVDRTFPAEVGAGRLLEGLQGDRHGLISRLPGADERAKGFEAQMTVQLELPRRAGRDGQVIALLAAVAPEEPEKALEDLSAAGA